MLRAQSYPHPRSVVSSVQHAPKDAMQRFRSMAPTASGSASGSATASSSASASASMAKGARRRGGGGGGGGGGGRHGHGHGHGHGLGRHAQGGSAVETPHEEDSNSPRSPSPHARLRAMYSSTQHFDALCRDFAMGGGGGGGGGGGSMPTGSSPSSSSLPLLSGLELADLFSQYDSDPNDAPRALNASEFDRLLSDVLMRIQQSLALALPRYVQQSGLPATFLPTPSAFITQLNSLVSASNAAALSASIFAELDEDKDGLLQHADVARVGGMLMRRVGDSLVQGGIRELAASHIRCMGER